MSFLDPFGLLGPRPSPGERAAAGDRSPPGDPVRDWLDATSSWTDPRWWLAQASAGRATRRTLLALAGGLAERFTGRELEVRVGGRTIRGVLDTVRVDAGGSSSALTGPLASTLPGSEVPPVDLRLQAHDVEVDGIVIQSVSVVASDVRLTIGLPAAVEAGPIEGEVRITEAQAARWLARWVPAQWALEAAGSGRVVASRRDHPLELELEPVLRGAMVQVELRSATWRGVRVRVPPWLRLARRRPLPPLPGGLELVEAWHGDGVLNGRVRLGHHRQELRLERLREAVARDDPTLELGDGPDLGS